jgi:hypothetical protein
MVRKNKTDFRSLGMDRSLLAILKVKLNNPNPSHTFNLSSSLIEKSKKNNSNLDYYPASVLYAVIVNV